MRKTNKCVLFYFQGNKIAYDQLSLALLFQKNKVQVVFYTPYIRGSLHSALDSHKIMYFGVRVKDANSTIRSLILDAYTLFNYLRLNNVSLFFSHLPLNNLLASMLSTFFKYKTRFITVRHHTDYILKGKNKNAKTIDFLVNKIAPKIQVISDRSINHLLKIEKVKWKKLLRLNLYFDFSLFPEPNMVEVNRIKQLNHEKKIILTIGRLIPVKNHLFLLDVIKHLKHELSFVLLILGEGAEFEKLDKKIKEDNLQNEVQLLGYKNNVFDYIKAADLIVHLSNSENSSGVAKEAAVLETAFLGFKSVGDSNAFLNKETGYPLAKNSSEKKIANEIKHALEDIFSVNKARNMKKLMIENHCSKDLENQYLTLIQ